MDTSSYLVLVIFILMLIFYILEDRSPWFLLAFAAACLAAAAYFWATNAWPFAVAQVFWAGASVWRWRKRSIAAA